LIELAVLDRPFGLPVFSNEIHAPPIDDDDGLFEMVLGVIFGFGAGLCILGLGAAAVFAFFPEHIPALQNRLVK
jgi:hypothetical protein